MSQIQQSIIGSLLLTQSLKQQKKITNQLLPDFFTGKFIDIIRKIKELSDKDILLDLTNLKVDQDLLLECIAKSSLIANFENALEELKEEYLQNNIVNLKNLGSLEEVKQTIAMIEEKAQILDDTKLQTIQSIINNSFKILNHDISNLVKTGFKDVDENQNSNKSFTGFLPGQLCTIGGYSGIGKSTLLFSLIKNIASNHETLVFNLEMDCHVMSSRILSSSSGVPFEYCHSIGNPKTQEMIAKYDLSQKLSDGIKKIEQMKLKIVDDQYYIDKIINSIRKEAKDNNLEFVFIDYLQLITTNSNKQRHLEIGEITRQLKLLAKELKIVIIILAQLSRATLTREEPEIQDLRESGSIEMDSDLIFLIWRKKTGESMIRLAKDRMFGKSLIANLTYDPKTKSYQ
jgi:replicative DNA helicase